MRPRDMVKSLTWESPSQAPESMKFAKDEEDTALSLKQNYIPVEEI